MKFADGVVESTDKSVLGKGVGKENRNKCPLGDKCNKSVATLPWMKRTRYSTNLALILLWEKRKRNLVTISLDRRKGFVEE